jgi:type III restriction enzyme
MKAFLSRPRIADKAYFLGKTLKIEKGNIIINDTMASDIEFYLIKQDYVDTKRNLTKKYYDDVKNETVAPFPDALKIHANEIITLINGLFSDNAIPSPDNGRAKKQNPLNDNFNKKEFKALWERINRKAIYQVDFDSNELIKHCVTTLNQSLKVTSLYFNIQKGEQREQTTYEQLVAGDGFCVKESSAKKYELFSHNKTPYDLIGKIATNTELTRKTIADILSNIEPTTFKQFQENPEQFILETSRLINEQKASMVIEHLSYDETHQTYDVDIFTAGQYIYNFQGLGQTLKKHIYDYVITDSNIEKQFATHLDASNEVVVYAKLPRGFLIPTPVGDYNPDWAISFKEGLVKHIYFVAETKGSMSTSNFRGYEKTKTDCARIFFEKLNQKINHETVKYDTVTTFDDLIKKADMHTLKGIV